MSNEKFRIVFMDVDGVLNNPESGYGGFVVGRQEEYFHEQILWDKACVDRLMRICNSHPNVRIVVSSFWRIDFNLDDFARFFEIYMVTPKLLDRTADLTLPMTAYQRFKSAAPRAEEVALWLRENADKVESFVILDDMAPNEFFLHTPATEAPTWPMLASRYVMTDDLTGLTDADVDVAIALLETAV